MKKLGMGYELITKSSSNKYIRIDYNGNFIFNLNTNYPFKRKYLVRGFFNNSILTTVDEVFCIGI